MKVKMFQNQGDAPKLEKEVSHWLSENKASPSHSQFKQSYVYDSKNDVFHILVSIWYEESAFRKEPAD